MKKVAIIGERSYTRNDNYFSAIEHFDAQAKQVLPADGIDAIYDVDGILLPGGDDINPKLYHEENTDSIDVDDELDAFEYQVIRKAIEMQKPILGICRGHQMLNVYFGGSLIQHIASCEVHAWIDKHTDRVHGTVVEPDSFLYELYRAEHISVNSAHHQAIRTLGQQLRVLQKSDDGLIEAICHETLPIYGVQWHPERMCLRNARPDTVDGGRIFEFFVGKL